MNDESGTLKPPPPKRSKTQESEERENDDDDDDGDKIMADSETASDLNSSSNNKHKSSSFYKLLPGYGEHKRSVSSVKFAPTRLTKRDALCASSAADGVIKLWDLRDCLSANSNAMADEHEGVIATTNNANATATTSAAADPDATATADATTAAGDAEEDTTTPSARNNGRSRGGSGGKLLEPKLSCQGHARGINEICWNPVSPLLASASDDKTVRLWDAVTGDPLVEYRGHDNFVFCVDQHEHMVVSGSFDETVKIWDIRSGDCVTTLPAHSDPVTSVSFSRDGTVVCSASHDGLIRLWDVPTGECLKTIYAAGNPPVCMAKFSPNSKYILAGTLVDATLRLWPVQRTGSNQCARSYSNEKHHTNSKYSIAADFTYDGNIVTGSETGELVLYDTQSAETLQVLRKHEDAVLAVSAHDRYPLLASGSMMEDRRVYFWAPRNYELPKSKNKNNGSSIIAASDAKAGSSQS